MTRLIRSVTLASAVLLLSSAGVRAADQTILGKVFLVKDPAPDASPDPTKRVIKVFGKETASPNTIVGDPTVTGATLRIIANGANDYDQTFPMPAAGWLPFGNGTGFKYRDAGAFGAVRIALVRASLGKFQIKAVIHGDQGPVTVEAPNPGTDGGGILGIVGGDSYCMAFGGAAGGSVVNFPSGNPFKVFLVKNPTSEGCPSSPSGAFLDDSGASS
jgi:hypothetical protein